MPLLPLPVRIDCSIELCPCFGVLSIKILLNGHRVSGILHIQYLEIVCAGILTLHRGVPRIDHTEVRVGVTIGHRTVGNDTSAH
jgi:hypothetical protein